MKTAKYLVAGPALAAKALRTQQESSFPSRPGLKMHQSRDEWEDQKRACMGAIQHVLMTGMSCPAFVARRLAGA